MIPMGIRILLVTKMGFALGIFLEGCFSQFKNCGMPSQIGWRLGPPGKLGNSQYMRDSDTLLAFFFIF